MSGVHLEMSRAAGTRALARRPWISPAHCLAGLLDEFVARTGYHREYAIRVGLGLVDRRRTCLDAA
jgi:hypothetical protein